jgi:hypothetical protein
MSRSSSNSSNSSSNSDSDRDRNGSHNLSNFAAAQLPEISSHPEVMQGPQPDPDDLYLPFTLDPLDQAPINMADFSPYYNASIYDSVNFNTEVDLYSTLVL